jgi:hypothetical protein
MTDTLTGAAENIERAVGHSPSEVVADMGYHST